jgi:hypothetical protein
MEERAKQKIMSGDIPNELCKDTSMKKRGHHLV